ncbi:uncharacterized protein PV09_02809 [Verruconis gallopava]|uniref:rRNA-processing protein EFG1 n=1 Tax=Verruconis gallopava TaxID=253628 RepID=A0A0D1Z060_9PEZI|nr:uncharacterized protein PV09_02809 [Verruconis gallopava]KIW06347.1 hypothetical protein PV09_02809 [Verruconis gallopava]
MSRIDGSSTNDYNRGEPFRVDKYARFKAKKRDAGRDERRKNGKSRAKAANTGITPLKRRIRSLSRLLSNNPKIPADVKISHEREIQSLQHELVNVLLDKEKHEMIGKYHKVRFFERQRATRRLKKAMKALEACEDAKDRPELERKVHIAQVDVNYPQYYPYMKVYQSLWKRETTEDGEEQYTANNEQEDGAKGNIEVWRQVEKAMEDGTLEGLKDIVEESKIAKIRNTVVSFGYTSKGSAKSKDNKNETCDGDEQDETGAGFFE